MNETLMIAVAGALALAIYAFLVHKAENMLREHRIKQESWQNQYRQLEQRVKEGQWP